MISLAVIITDMMRMIMMQIAMSLLKQDSDPKSKKLEDYFTSDFSGFELMRYSNLDM